ncbi:MAG: ComF family protein [Bacteroidales bacterium]|nr:ComF family protein [Bacteroidales bacterium]
MSGRKQVLHEVLNGLVQLFLPSVCMLCGERLMDAERHVCRVCLDGLPATGFEDHPTDNEMTDKMREWMDVERGISFFYYRSGEGASTIVEDFKYRGQSSLAYEMGREIGMRGRYAGAFDGIDYLVPVPLHKDRIASRGYNQSELIAKGIGAATGIEVLTDVLWRSTFKGTQTRLNGEERRKNVKGSFELTSRSSCLAGRHVAIVDDVFTTGATVEACAETLRGAGEVRVSVVTLCFSYNG